MSWESMARKAGERPGSFALKAGLVIIGLSVVFGAIGSVRGWFGEAADTAQEEFGARAALEKYEWFKDAAQSLGAKKQDIQNYEALVRGTEGEWADTPRTEWPRDVRQSLQQNKQELAGLITAYNALVAEYRAASAKFNWSSFEDREDRPPLEFDEYAP